MKLAGSDVVTAVSDIENMLDEESKILNKLPVVVPFAPMFRANKSPVAVVADPGVQSILTNVPIPADPVRDVAVLRKSKSVPEVKVLAVPVEN